MDHALSAAKVVSNDKLRRLIIPAIVLGIAAAAGYVLNQIPRSLPTPTLAQDFIPACGNRLRPYEL